MTSVRIEGRFRGPHTCGNGGYVCGRLGTLFDGPAQVRLHAPTPLDRDLKLDREPERIRLLDGDTLLGTAVPHAFTLETPPIPDLESAREASRSYAAFAGHPFATCFVCGTDRAEGDGLRLFAGPLSNGVVAAPFRPPGDLLDERRNLRPEFVWAALDCPGFFAGLGTDLCPMLLGEFAVERRAPVPGQEATVVVGWKISEEGRKIRAGTAIATAKGEVLGVGLATWIRPRTM